MTSRRAVWVVVTLGLLWACAETTGPGVYHARLSIYPEFAGAQALAGTGSDVDSFVVRISNPPLPDVDTTVVIPAGQDEITLTLDVPISSALDTVTVLFRGYSSTTGLLLYQGSQDLAVRAGVPAPPVPVQAAYVGPGAGIDSLVLSPASVFVTPSGTQQLDYTGYRGTTVLADDSVPVRWFSTDTAIATVSGLGLVTGRANGTARVVCISVARSAVRDTAPVTVANIVAPAIGLSPTSVSFAGTVGQTVPAAQTVGVSNTGGGTLSGLAVGTVTYGPGASGWLTVSLSGTAAPTQLSVQPNTTALAAGSYAASVPVTAAGASNSPQTVSVTYTVAAAPAIGLTPTALTFTATAGGAAPAGQNVSISNSGGATLTGLAVGTISYGPGASGWLSFTLSSGTAPTTLALRPSTVPTTAGSYTATVPVTSPVASNSPQSVGVTLNVGPGAATRLTVSPGYASLIPGGTQALTLAASDAFNNTVPTTGATFVSRSPSVATVSGAGLVTGVGGGTAVIVATLGSATDSMTVGVAASGSVVVSAIGDARASDQRVVGDTVRVLVSADLRGVSGTALGSYNAQLNWTPSVLRYVRTDVVSGGFVAPTLNETQVTAGQLRFGAADAVGSTGPTVGLVQVVFVANATGSSPLTFTVSELWAAGTFANLLPAAVVYGGAVRVQ